MTAVETMKEILKDIKAGIVEYQTESGFIKPECYERYGILVDKARSFKESIEWMEAMYSDNAGNNSG